MLIQFSEYVHKSYINADIGNKYFYGTYFASFFLKNLFKALLNDAICGSGVKFTTPSSVDVNEWSHPPTSPTTTLSWCGLGKNLLH